MFKRKKQVDTSSKSTEPKKPIEHANIRIENLTHYYSKGMAYERKAIDDINIEIGNGEIVGLIGHTGSGKSTLIQHLNALLKPSSGTIYLDDFDVFSDKSRLREIRQKVGLVFQYPEYQLFEETIYKDVAFGAKNLGLDEEEVDRRVRQALKSVSIDESLFEKSPYDISGGQKRRVAIAGILVMQPIVLVLDEPTAGLDPKGRHEIFNLIEDMHKEYNMTIIIASHSMEDIAEHVNRVIVLERGKLKYFDTPRNIFIHEEELNKIGLTVPRVSTLMKALQNEGHNVRTDIFKIDEAVDELYKLLKD